MMRPIRKIALALGCALLAAALPVAAAFAVDSPENQTIHSGATGTIATVAVNGESVSVQMTVSVDGKVLNSDFEAWKLVSNPVTAQASLASTAPSNSVVFGSFETHPELVAGALTEDQMWERATSYTYAFSFDLHTNAFDGKTAYVYFDHHNGSTETQRSVVENGSITVYTSLSNYTVVIDMGSGGGINADTGAISPRTGAGASSGIDGAAAGAAADTDAANGATATTAGPSAGMAACVLGCAACACACVAVALVKRSKTRC